MKRLKVGILDEEEAYVNRLAAYLSRQGKWNIAAFTEKSPLMDYLGKRSLDILVATNQEDIWKLQKEHPDICYIWLTGQKSKDPDIRSGSMKAYLLFRYQSAGAISRGIQEIVEGLDLNSQMQKPMIALYSPVGRCGKTSLALRITEQEMHGKCLYIGLEDYSSFHEEEGRDTEVFFYFVKERREDRVLEWIAQSGGKISSAGSPFDTKQIGGEDIKWLQTVMQKSESCRGTVFDIGTGVLAELEVFLLFDVLIVPYLTEEKAMRKKENFERLLHLCGLSDVLEKTWFIDMEREEQIRERMEELFRFLP